MSRYASTLLLEREEPLAWVTLNRPGDRNAINSRLMADLESLLDELETGPVRTVIFEGAGDRFFIGGADAVEMMRCSPEEALAFSGRIQGLFNRMEASPLILVAALNGLCYGGGCEFALACDLRIAADTVRIGLPEVRVGIIPGGGGTQRLPRVVGKGRAMEMILKGRLYEAKEALAMGLVNDVVPAETLHQACAEHLKPIMKNPQHALSQAKSALQAAQNFDFADGLHVEKEHFKACFEHDFFTREISRQLQSGQMPSTEDWKSSSP